MLQRLTVWLILALTILAVWFNLPQFSQLPNSAKFFNWEISLTWLKGNFLTSFIGAYPIKLGLDLQGGVECVLQAHMDSVNSTDQSGALEGARQVIERRVNLYGVSEALVQSTKVGSDRRILVQLPGSFNLQNPCSSIGQTAQLEFRELESTASAESSASAGINYLNTKGTGLTGKDLKKATVTFDQTGKAGGPQVQLQFTGEGQKKFAEITKRNVSKQLPIFLDYLPISAPVVQQEIIGGNAVISGQFTAASAKDLAIKLNAGALPVSLSTLSQQTIPPTLGQRSINKSLLAGFVGITTVMIFMVAYYGLYGLIADLALGLYILLTLAVFRTGAFILPPVALSLAGITGFVLSIGMAVDANILIFERIKEERYGGKVGRQALNLGFSRAWSSIRDSNISSIITALVLFTFGTSIVRGFALTLMIGVLISMFSAIVVSRTLLGLLPRFKK
ncbi:protein translocase subunit SecD [Candidatus Daviesbacteria bacterium]|nr:protein translocase subunit SecD [Candidatus Daviesbacteria bacterium]